MRKQLAASEEAYAAAIQAAVGGYGDWAHVRQAGEVFKQATSALKNSEELA